MWSMERGIEICTNRYRWSRWEDSVWIKWRRNYRQFTWNKNCGPNPNSKWEIVKECKKFSPGDKMCDLCTSEKLYILKCANDVNNINLRNDVGTRCCHVRNTRLGAITWILRGTIAAKWSTLQLSPPKIASNWPNTWRHNTVPAGMSKQNTKTRWHLKSCVATKRL